jgi:hydrogenase maturation protease
MHFLFNAFSQAHGHPLMTGANDQATTPRKILIAGIGNTLRGDDAVGPAVVKSIADRLPGGVRGIVSGGDMFALIEEWKNADAVICVDAAASMGSPGRVHRFDLNADEIPRELSLVSSHVFGLAEAIELARALRMIPAHLIVFAIEGHNFKTGSEMTPEILSAAKRVEEQIIDEIETLQRLLKKDVAAF